MEGNHTTNPEYPGNKWNLYIIVILFHVIHLKIHMNCNLFNGNFFCSWDSYFQAISFTEFGHIYVYYLKLCIKYAFIFLCNKFMHIK